MERNPDFFGFFICVLLPVLFMFFVVVLTVINAKSKK